MCQTRAPHIPWGCYMGGITLGDDPKVTLVWETHKYNTTQSLKHVSLVKGKMFLRLLLFVRYVPQLKASPLDEGGLFNKM